MTSDFFYLSVSVWTLIGISAYIVMTFWNIKAPYGRHSLKKPGLTIANHWGWFLMELPALLLFPLLILYYKEDIDWYLYLIGALWIIHYGYRTLIFPFKLNTKGKRMPVSILWGAVFFNVINGGLNASYFIFFYETPAPLYYIVPGLIIFFFGMYINKSSDRYLISLRTTSVDYQIPQGKLFQWISCPNHFGEMIEWLGFALIAWNPAAFSFFIWTFCNLAPRARNHHEWYNQHFEAYPKSRKALIPFLW